MSDFTYMQWKDSEFKGWLFLPELRKLIILWGKSWGIHLKQPQLWRFSVYQTTIRNWPASKALSKEEEVSSLVPQFYCSSVLLLTNLSLIPKSRTRYMHSRHIPSLWLHWSLNTTHCIHSQDTRMDHYMVLLSCFAGKDVCLLTGMESETVCRAVLGVCSWNTTFFFYHQPLLGPNSPSFSSFRFPSFSSPKSALYSTK